MATSTSIQLVASVEQYGILLIIDANDNLVSQQEITLAQLNAFKGESDQTKNQPGRDLNASLPKGQWWLVKGKDKRTGQATISPDGQLQIKTGEKFNAKGVLDCVFMSLLPEEWSQQNGVVFIADEVAAAVPILVTLAPVVATVS